MNRFADRVDAGRQLAQRLAHLQGRDVVVLGLPRGGVPVAFEVAARLHAPLDVIVVRKLGLPFQPELAMGAIGEGDHRVVDDDLVRRAGVSSEAWQAVETRERRELKLRIDRYRHGREPVDLHDRVAVIVDDGIATGSTARVACGVPRRLGATEVVLAAPVAAWQTVQGMNPADEVVCVTTPRHLGSVGEYYEDFSPTPDEEVIALLHAGQRGLGTNPSGS
jgi:putative phosphoribosyl transferase